MKISDLSHVNTLKNKLGDLEERHEFLKSLLTVNHHGLPHKVRLDIGGDQYGNGKYKTVIDDLQNVEYVVKIIARESEDVWGKIVGIRIKLRDLGVEL